MIGKKTYLKAKVETYYSDIQDILLSELLLSSFLTVSLTALHHKQFMLMEKCNHNIVS